MMGIDFTNALLTGALVYTFVNFLKNVVNWKDGGANAAITQLVAWAAGVGAVFLVSSGHVLSAAEFINHIPLNKLSIGDKAIAGLVASSSLGVVVDGIKAWDGSQTAAHPALLSKYRARHAAKTVHKKVS